MVDQLLVVIKVALHVAKLDQVLNTFLDHPHVGHEEADFLDDSTDQLLGVLFLQALHDSHGNGVNDVLSLDGDRLVDLAHDIRLRLVLHHLLGGELRDEVLLEGIGLVLHVDEDFFVRVIEVGLAARILHDACLGLAEVVLEGLDERCLVDSQLVHELFAGDAVFLVQLHQDSALRDRDLGLVVILQVGCLDDDRALVVKPVELAILEFFIVEVLKDMRDVAQLRRNAHFGRRLERPLAHCEDLSVELDSLDRVCASGLRLLERLEKILRLADVHEHGLHLRHDIVAALYLQLLDDRLLRLVIAALFVEQTFGE